ncbi:hypothetical protein ACJ72_04247 [Emergomyces africanus]|uniref:Uncharacterized protein n=1 Tax=Emergomyces africanus TaxID=1955775 RepID=A0A1B7NXA8_9EURO|nr:hypothetical protein ACJ72_04247 [Emergomyces africanus]
MTYSLSDDYCAGLGVSKPDHPYMTGNALTVRSHISPPPNHEKTPALQRILCVRGRKYIHSIAVSPTLLLQLAVVQVQTVTPLDFPPTGFNLLAKIYDPLYFDHVQDDANPFQILCVDRDYSCEAAAYTVLS